MFVGPERADLAMRGLGVPDLAMRGLGVRGLGDAQTWQCANLACRIAPSGRQSNFILPVSFQPKWIDDICQ
jgi:hypothetical protein